MKTLDTLKNWIKKKLGITRLEDWAYRVGELLPVRIKVIVAAIHALESKAVRADDKIIGLVNRLDNHEKRRALFVPRFEKLVADKEILELRVRELERYYLEGLSVKRRLTTRIDDLGEQVNEHRNRLDYQSQRLNDKIELLDAHSVVIADLMAKIEPKTKPKRGK
jgi:hypothetical protein